MSIPNLNNTKTNQNLPEVNESEKKRLESLKRQKESYRNKENAIKKALKNLDNKSNKNKIIFDDDIDKIGEPKTEKKKKKKKHALFDEDDNDKGDSTFNDFKLRTDKSGKILERAITLGNDDRFKLDERFMENDNFEENGTAYEEGEEADLQKEKDMQLGILEDILGVPINKKQSISTKDQKPSNKGMIRYDPTMNDHKEYEIVQNKEEANGKKVKKKRRIENVENANENLPVEVSKDVYFSVSESLTKSLKEGGQFSLLKTYSKEESVEQEEKSFLSEEGSKKQNFKFNFDTKNPFKYDSSDGEGDQNNDKYISSKQEVLNNESWESSNFFFDVNDVRFKEAENFFSQEPTSVNQFQNLRRELKQIVRSKIQKNIKRHQPWGRKRKIKRLS